MSWKSWAQWWKLLPLKKHTMMGTMDVSTRGVKVFRTLEVVKDIPEKLYSGAIVTYPDNAADGNRAAMEKLLSRIRQLHLLLKISKDFKKAGCRVEVIWCGTPHWSQSGRRIWSLEPVPWSPAAGIPQPPFRKAIAVLLEMENLKEKVRLNGHFKNLQSFNFDV